MSSVYTGRLALYHNLSEDAIIPPDDQVWVIRNITMFVGAGTPAAQMQLTDHESDCTFFWERLTDVVVGSYNIATDLRLVLEPGIQTDISASAGFGVGVDVTLHGYKLSLP